MGELIHFQMDDQRDGSFRNEFPATETSDEYLLQQPGLVQRLRDAFHGLSQFVRRYNLFLPLRGDGGWGRR